MIIAKCQNCFRWLPRTRHHVNGHPGKKRKRKDRNCNDIMYLCRECHDIYDFIAGKRTIMFRPQYQVCLRAVCQQYHKKRNELQENF
jgi:hypothetical protein